MKTIIIDGVIGWDVYNSTIRNSLKEANGEDVMIEISSPGGFVYEGLSIFNSIRDYSRNYNNVTVKLTGLAASMASYIALAGNKLLAEDNAVFMIHNVWSITWGDYRQMQKDAKEIEKLTDLLANTYVKKTGKSKAEIRNLMDDESFFFGEEALKEGFVDEIIENNQNVAEKDSSITMAKARVKTCFDKMKDSERSKTDLEKAAALLPKTNLNQSNTSSDLDTVITIDQDKIRKEKNNIMEVTNNMDERKLKAEYPELYDSIMQLGVEKERKRVNAHITLGKKSGAIDKSLAFIASGQSILDEEVQAEYISGRITNKLIDNRADDNVDNQNTAPEDVIDEEDTKKMTNQILKSRGVKA